MATRPPEVAQKLAKPTWTSDTNAPVRISIIEHGGGDWVTFATSTLADYKTRLTLAAADESRRGAADAWMKFLRDSHEIRPQGLVAEGVAMSASRYPVWLNGLSAVSLILLTVGIFLIFFSDVTSGAALAAAGSIGVWVAGSLAPTYRARRNGTNGYR